MSATRSSAGARSAVRLLVTLLALVLAETLLAAPRRLPAGLPQGPGTATAGDPVPPATAGPTASSLAAAADAGSLPGGAVAVADAGLGSSRASAPTLSGPVAERSFPTASLVKLFVAADVLHRARAGLVVLDGPDHARLRAMVRSSDDAAASALWVRHGGGRMVTDVAARFGLTGTAPPAVPGRWGQAVTTARDVAVFLARLPVLAHPDDAAALLGWMAEAAPVAADGYDQRFGLLALPGAVAAKQGWMCCPAGMRHLHSAGIRDGRVVVLLSETPAAAGEAAARARLDAVAAALPPPRPPAARC
jgi:hypothetical protein